MNSFRNSEEFIRENEENHLQKFRKKTPEGTMEEISKELWRFLFELRKNSWRKCEAIRGNIFRRIPRGISRGTPKEVMEKLRSKSRNFDDILKGMPRVNLKILVVG